MSLINKQMQIALGLEQPDSDQAETKIAIPVVIEPDELPLAVQNSDLPDMSDIDQRQAEGEKQLEAFIQKGSTLVDTILDDEYPNAEPRFRRGVLEQGVLIYTAVLAAIQHKNKLQLEKRKQRLAEAGFSKGSPSPGQTGASTTNMFFGTREQMVEMMKQNGLLEEEK